MFAAFTKGAGIKPNTKRLIMRTATEAHAVPVVFSVQGAFQGVQKFK